MYREQWRKSIDGNETGAGKGIVLTGLAAHAGDLDCRFENGGVRGHGVAVPVITESFRWMELVARAHMSLYAMYHPSTRSLAQGVLRRNVRLDFTLGSWRKQRIGTRRPISAQPYRSTNSLMMVSRVIPCKGSQGWERLMIVSQRYGADRRQVRAGSV